MADQNSIFQAFVTFKQELLLLAFSGSAGAFFRAVLTPEERWRRRLVQGLAGALSAIFLGGVVAHVISTVTGAGLSAYLAAGFIMGSGGEAAVKAIQNRMMEKR